MPRVNIPITQLSQAGVAPPAQVSSDATNDHELAYNDGRVFLEVTNTNAGAQTVTIPTPGLVGGLNIEDISVSVPGSNGVRLIGPLPMGLVNQADGKVHIDVTIATDLKFRAYHL